MEVIDYIKLAQSKPSKKSTGSTDSINITIITNFTDDLLKKIVAGMCLELGVRPDIYTVPYKQYLFELKNSKSKLWKTPSDITYIFFDINPYIKSEFISDKNHLKEVLNDLANFCKKRNSKVILQTAIKSPSIQHGRLLKENIIDRTVDEYNKGLRKISEETPNTYISETEKISHAMGDKSVRDMRGLYAFSQPWSNNFLFRICKEWFTFIKAQKGKVFKCIVLDLDNTLWGGVVGESGPLGIQLGHEYPGNAFLEFQRTILDFYDKGVILAINSRNNPEDVDEVFEKNKHMLLKKFHFAGIAVNWNNKAENLCLLAKDLNIGLDSMIFIDDDMMNRDLVRKELPEVLVPEWSFPPEEYVRSILNIDAFHSLAITTEDKERGKMYAAERERKEIFGDESNLGDYLKTLRVKIDLHLNNKTQIERLTQLTQKTNQFNLTTKRLTEQNIEKIMSKGFVFSGDVSDKFGPYGITILAILEKNKKELELTNFLMSCRVMGRKVEKAFMNSILEELSKRGFEEITAHFIPTSKNTPAKNFLPSLSVVKQIQTKSGSTTYSIKLTDKNKSKFPIKINKLF